MPLVKVAVAIRKGGQGKTTTARLLSEFFGKVRKKRVLLMDFDSQCNLSTSYLELDVSSLGTRPPIHPGFDAASPNEDLVAGRSSTAEIFFSGRVSPYSVTKVPGMETVDILPADEKKLVQVEEQDRTKLKDKVEGRLEEFFGAASEDLESSYDLVVMDTPPSESPLTRSTLRAATHLLIPFDCEALGVDGMYKMLGMWRQENRRRPAAQRLELLAIQPNRYKGRRASQEELLTELRSDRSQISQYVSSVSIPDLNEFATIYLRDAKPQSVFDLNPKNSAKKIAMEFGEEMERRLAEPPSATEPEAPDVDEPQSLNDRNAQVSNG